MIFMIFCVFIWCYFWCIFMCSCVLFLVQFSRVFCRAFSGVFWWFCWWYFLCFSGCFFHCILVLFSVHFFVLVPFLFYKSFPLVVVLFFAVLFLVVFGCFFRAFFRAFFLCFFCALYRAFFRAFFRSFSCFFSCFFFRALGGTQDKQPQYFAFWPVLFLVLFLVVTTSEDRKYTRYIYCFPGKRRHRMIYLLGQVWWWYNPPWKEMITWKDASNDANHSNTTNLITEYIVVIDKYGITMISRSLWWILFEFCES